ncbi:MAG: GtrA family protein [Oscillospiraceae bacterium]
MKLSSQKKLAHETVMYLIFGVLTTLISYVAFWIPLKILGTHLSLVANTISFIVAVTFAYVTNKLYVFKSKSWKLCILKKELPSFLGMRIISFAFEQIGLFFCQNALHLETVELFGIEGLMIAKIVLSVVVIILNYCLSKFFIFKTKNSE